MQTKFNVTANGAVVEKNGVNTFTFDEAMSIIEENKDTMANVSINEVTQFYVAVNTDFGIIIYKDNTGNQLFTYSEAQEAYNIVTEEGFSAEIVRYNQRKLIASKIYQCLNSGELTELLNGYAIVRKGNPYDNNMVIELIKDNKVTCSVCFYNMENLGTQILHIINDFAETIG